MAVRGPKTVAFAVRGPIACDDLPGLCRRIRALLETSGAEVAFCDVRGVEPNAVTADALARLQLAARRTGCQIRVCHASTALKDLLGFMGLSDVLPDAATSPVAAGARRAGRAAPYRGRR
jgi:hypothetical protein